MDKKLTFAQRLAASLANTDAAALESFPYGRKSKAVDPWETVTAKGHRAHIVRPTFDLRG